MRTVGTVVEYRVGLPHFSQPPINRQVLMWRRDAVVVLQLGVHLRAAYRLWQHNDIAVVKLGNHEIGLAVPLDGHQVARRRAKGCFDL